MLAFSYRCKHLIKPVLAMPFIYIEEASWNNIILPRKLKLYDVYIITGLIGIFLRWGNKKEFKMKNKLLPE